MGRNEVKIPKARQLSSGSWFIQLRLNGKSISITKPTEKEAIAEAMAVKEGILKIKSTPLAKKTLSEAIDLWLEDNSARLSPATVRGYRICQKNGFPTLMKMKCGKITQAQIASAVNSECKHYSAKTVTNRWRFIAQVLTWATGESYPTKLPQVVRPDIEFLDDAEITTFLEYIKGKPVEIPALLALSSLRRSEIAGLTWDNIDLENRWIHVRGAVVLDEHNDLVKKKTTKNTVSRRDVPIIDPLYIALKAVENKEGPVVLCRPAAIWRNINKACAAAGVPEVGCHGLRHSFASLCHSLGIPAQAAMEIGGWSDRATMDRIYTHVSKRSKTAYENAFTAHFSIKTEENENPEKEKNANSAANETQNA